MTVNPEGVMFCRMYASIAVGLLAAGAMAPEAASAGLTIAGGAARARNLMFDKKDGEDKNGDGNEGDEGDEGHEVSSTTAS